MAIGPIPTAQKEPTFKKPCLWARMLPMPGACTTCTVTFGNGAAIGMEIIPAAPKPILKVPHRVRIGFCVGVGGAPAANFPVLRAVASGAPLPTAPAAVAFGLSYRVNSGNQLDLYPPKVVARTTCPEGRGSFAF